MMNTTIPFAAQSEKQSVFTHVRKDALAGIITGLMSIPSTIGICLLSEYPIQSGLATIVAACVISFIVYLIRPGNFNGVPSVAAGLAPLLALGIHTFGMENMPFMIFLTAVFQAVIWKFNLQKYVIKIVPPYLVEGLLAGIGLRVFDKFLPFTFDTTHQSSTWFSDERMMVIAASIGTFLVFLFLYRKYQKKMPALPYVITIVIGVFLAYYVSSPMLHVEPVTFGLALPMPHFHKLTPLLFGEIVGYGIMLAMVDVIEQVMSNAAIEKIDPYKRKTNSRNSVLSMWLGNLTSSFFGGMTNLDILQTSSINITAGAVTKLSNLFTSATIVFFIFNYELLEMMPHFLLGVLMLFVGWKMISGLFHTAEKGRYALMLALICAILVYKYGMFEGLLIVMVVHAFIYFVIERHNQTPTLDIVRSGIQLFSDKSGDPHSTETMICERDEKHGGKVYRSTKRNPSDKKSLEEFLLSWGESVNQHSVPRVVGHYDAKAMLWGTFAQKLNAGHEAISHYFDHLLNLPAVHVDFETFEFRQYGDIYVQSGTYHFSYDKKGEKMKVPARYSFVCKKERTGWYILEHHSSEFPA